jgi:hypothetical protein
MKNSKEGRKSAKDGDKRKKGMKKERNELRNHVPK